MVNKKMENQDLQAETSWYKLRQVYVLMIEFQFYN